MDLASLYGLCFIDFNFSKDLIEVALTSLEEWVRTYIEGGRNFTLTTRGLLFFHYGIN